MVEHHGLLVSISLALVCLLMVGCNHSGGNCNRAILTWQWPPGELDSAIVRQQYVLDGQLVVPDGIINTNIKELNYLRKVFGQLDDRDVCTLVLKIPTISETEWLQIVTRFPSSMPSAEIGQPDPMPFYQSAEYQKEFRRLVKERGLRVELLWE